jgi:hypothetical protein
MRALFFAFFLLLRALNSSRVVKRTLSLTVRVPFFCTYCLLCNLRCVAALFAALSLAMRFCNNTSLCAITAAPFAIFLRALTIEVSELSTCL